MTGLRSKICNVLVIMYVSADIKMFCSCLGYEIIHLKFKTHFPLAFLINLFNNMNPISWPVLMVSISPPRSAVSSSTCPLGNTSRTCSMVSQSCLFPRTPNHLLRVWWNSSNCVEEQSVKLSDRRASALEHTMARDQREAGSCLNSGCLVRCLLCLSLSMLYVFLCQIIPLST